MSAVCSSECLPEAEKEVEVRCLADVLVSIDVGLRIVDVDGVDRRIQVVTEIKANGPYRRMVAQAQSGRMREVVETALALLSG